MYLRIVGQKDQIFGLELEPVSKANVAPKTDANSGAGTFQPEVVLAVLKSFCERDDQDDERALKELIQALDEDRAEGQKLFPVK